MPWLILIGMLMFGGVASVSPVDFMLRVFWLTVPEMAVGCVIWMCAKA